MPPLRAVSLQSLFFYLDMLPHHSSSSQLVQTSFEPNLYLYTKTSTVIPVILLVHTIYEDGTECSETAANKIQMPGNHPQERTQYGNETLCFRIVKEFIDYVHKYKVVQI